MGVFDFLFPNPSKAAQPYLNQVPGTISPYYQPFINAGNQALPQLQGQYNQLMQNPGDIIKRLGAGYQQSPGYQFALNQGEQGINNAQAAGGMLGTPQHQQMAGELATNLANQDYGNYLQRAMGLYGQGLQGEQGLMNQGFQGSTDLATSLAQALMNQGYLNYSGQGNQNNMTGGFLSDLFGFGSKAAPFIAGLF